MDDIAEDLPMSMTLAAFTGISWYIAIEVNISLFMLFQRRRGLYFWSCAVASWGVLLQPLFIILADYRVWSDFKGSITMIYLTWFMMVPPQSWILYSRLHLILQKKKMLKWIRAILIFNSIVFTVPTVVVGILAQATNVNPALKDKNIIWDRIQLTVFFVQETVLSLLYIYETRKYVRIHSILRRPSTETTATQTAKLKDRVFWHLIFANILVIALDIALLGIQYGGDHLFYLQGAFKPCVYGIKLKVEFLVLNSLISSLRDSRTPTPQKSNIQSGHGTETHVSAGPRSRGHSTDFHRSTPKQAAEEYGLEYVYKGKLHPSTRSRDGNHNSFSGTIGSEGDGRVLGRVEERWDAQDDTSWLRGPNERS